MKGSKLFWILSIVYFMIYFSLLRWIWNLYVPFNVITEIIAFLLIILIVIPFSSISATNSIKLLKK
ncbi:hypothetical protein [Clostridium grantii]|uniref:Uncharacterized protein n=1 Tax=Clostridium grantii DSM 8605 TaxID=1121316 RepID=A0A1M5XCN6_9CLOT|nr:hypothetical protein [Clostridium grantii]SHH96963.1 hypothetical protein SAMN02745207_03515 [Clostridium grantii DSM 8605]